jgi:hypothetical protein
VGPLEHADDLRLLRASARGRLIGSRASLAVFGSGPAFGHSVVEHFPDPGYGGLPVSEAFDRRNAGQAVPGASQACHGPQCRQLPQFSQAAEGIGSLWFVVAGCLRNVIVRIDSKGRHGYSSPSRQTAGDHMDGSEARELQADSVLYLVMEFLEGGTLAQDQNAGVAGLGFAAPGAALRVYRYSSARSNTMR